MLCAIVTHAKDKPEYSPSQGETEKIFLRLLFSHDLPKVNLSREMKNAVTDGFSLLIFPVGIIKKNPFWYLR